MTSTTWNPLPWGGAPSVLLQWLVCRYRPISIKGLARVSSINNSVSYSKDKRKKIDNIDKEDETGTSCYYGWNTQISTTLSTETFSTTTTTTTTIDSSLPPKNIVDDDEIDTAAATDAGGTEKEHRTLDEHEC